MIDEVYLESLDPDHLTLAIPSWGISPSSAKQLREYLIFGVRPPRGPTGGTVWAALTIDLEYAVITTMPGSPDPGWETLNRKQAAALYDMFMIVKYLQADFPDGRPGCPWGSEELVEAHIKRRAATTNVANITRE